MSIGFLEHLLTMPPLSDKRKLPVFGTKRNKEEHRYYLLPGMGRSNRRRHAQFVRWAIAVGIIISALLGVLLYYLNRVGV
jgi:uncharacterized membrane protein YozB (DUF420 family)